MSNYVLVAVSPFYNGRGWTDSLTGLSFEPKAYLHPTRISKEKDLSGIQNSVRMNNLLLLEGEFDNPAGEISVENLNPEELTKKQFDVLVEKLSSGSGEGIPQEEFDAAIAAKEAALAEKETAEAALAKAESDLTKANGSVTTLTNEKKAAETAKAKAESDLAALKDEYYKNHKFSEAELNGFTVAKIKEILDVKGIAYTNETKADLIAKLIAPEE